MPLPFLTTMMRSIGFDDRNRRLLRAFEAHLTAGIPELADCIRAALQGDPSVLAVFGSDRRGNGTRLALEAWIRELAEGSFDSEYFAKRAAVGKSHANEEIKQHHIFCAIEVLRQELSRFIRDSAVPDRRATIDAMHKLLMLELTVMLESYKDSYAADIRESERIAVEEKLTRAQHLAKIGQLAASLAHEIKNPLAGISGAIQVIRETMPPDDPHQPIILEILGQIDRLDATVKDLLLYARPTAPQRDEVLLAPMISRVLNVLREEPSLHRIRVRCDTPPDDLAILGDGRQIEQLIMNLILNAAHASDNGDLIHLGIEETPHAIRLTVRDAGRGMTPEVQRQAFEPFFTTKAKGTGLGLSICRRICEAHGGTIDLQSEVDKGTTVLIELPRRWDGARRVTDNDGTGPDR